MIQNAQLAGHHFDFAGGQIGIRFLAALHFSAHSDDKFRAQLFGLRLRGGILFLIENDLDESCAVAQVDKNQVAEIAAADAPSPSAQLRCRHRCREGLRNILCVSDHPADRARFPLMAVCRAASLRRAMYLATRLPLRWFARHRQAFSKYSVPRRFHFRRR